MQTVVVLFSARFEGWVKPASLLWLAAASPDAGVPWFLVSADRSTPEQVASEIFRIATQVINPSADWQILAVVDEHHLRLPPEGDSDAVFPEGTTDWIDRI